MFTLLMNIQIYTTQVFIKLHYYNRPKDYEIIDTLIQFIYEKNNKLYLSKNTKK